MADDSIDAHQTAPVEDVAEPLLKRAKLSEAATSSDSVATSVPTDIDPDILKNLGMPYQPNPLRFKVDAQCGRARACSIMLPHGPLKTPVFMPVGTKGTIKGLTPDQVKRHPLACEIILANTYHMGLHPGAENLKKLGGLHKFMRWDRNILTDSGGFQMVSLLELATITEEGVEFISPENDGTKMMLTPERSMEIQNCIGADIMMMLDDVVGSDTCDHARFAEAADRTVRWLDRCIKAHKRPHDQALFAIVQGGLDVSEGGLRERNLKDLVARSPYLGGFAIGGLAGGESKEEFWPVVEYCAQRLPSNKPRYCMGLGYAVDLLVSVALGVDMFDCVYPTRTARFGNALVPSGTLRLKHSRYKDDHRPICDKCECSVCAKYSRAALRALLTSDNGVGSQLVSIHNIAYMMDLSRSMRRAILEDDYPAYARKTLRDLFPDKPFPKWVLDAMAAAGIPLDPAPPAKPAASAPSGSTKPSSGSTNPPSGSTNPPSGSTNAPSNVSAEAKAVAGEEVKETTSTI